MKRFDVINASKFERLSNADMSSVKGGGICLLCMKRERYDKHGNKIPGWVLN